MKTGIPNLLIVVALIVSGNVARSANITWTNAAGGDWNNAQNWDLNQVPGSGDSASIPSGVNVMIDSTNSAGGLTLGYASTLTIASNGVLNIAGDVSLNGLLTNCGTVNWQGGQVVVNDYYGGEIWNEAGALWDIQCDQGLLVGSTGGNDFFNNAGVLQKDTTTGTTTISVYLNNSGSVHAESGTIQFTGSGDLGGSFQADSGAAIFFNGGSYILGSPPTNLQGPGPVQFTNIDLTLNDFTGTYILNSSTTLIGQNTVAATGTVTLTGNTLGYASTLTIASNGVLNIAGDVSLNGLLTNCGTVNWQGGQVVVNDYYGGEIWNEAGALWDIQCDQGLLVGSTGGNDFFNNAGVLQKDTTTGTTTISVYLNNNGILEAKLGTINLNGGYTETSSANQIIGIGGTAPGSGYGHISFSGGTFAGSFNTTLLNGFRPNSGNSFLVLNYSSLTGDFTSMNGLDLGNGLKLVPNFGSTNLTLVAATYSINNQPSLSLYPAPNNALLLSWPQNFTGWQLQTATNLTTPVWTPVTVNGNNNIVLPQTGSQGFFRLMSN